MKTSQILLRKHIILAVLAIAVTSAPAAADEAADVNALLQAKQFTAALAKTNAFLEKNPRDPQMQFLKGLALTGMDRQTEAVAVFTSLTVDHPELAEPYNNLAVIHASARQYDNARAALEKAIQVNPRYTRAYENLADLYVQLANQTYGKLLQLDPGNTNAKIRQSLLRTVTEQTSDILPPVGRQKAAANNSPALPTASAVQPPSPPTSSSADSEKEIVLSIVTEWARAWSARDVSAYLNFYGPNFRTPQQTPRPVWEKSRQTLIESKATIKVDIESPQVSIAGPLATVRYRQKYVSDNYTSTDRKTLILRKYDDSWKIVEERSGN